VAWTNDGRHIVTVSEFDETLRLFDESGKALHAIRDLPRPARIGVGPDGVVYVAIAYQRIDRFRVTPHAVLFGTSSFWEGVDVPGDALSLVVIDKLPFAPHTDPLVAARMQACAEAGGDPFEQIQLPSAAIALKQGFGRLIRRRDDRGIVALLDSRVVSRNYGRTFLASLPAGLPRSSSLEQVRRWWAAGSSNEQASAGGNAQRSDAGGVSERD